MNENRNFNEDFEIEQAGPEDVGCDLLSMSLLQRVHTSRR